MRSKHVETFNHDPWAADYDADVLDESDPIRTGYEALLSWVAHEAAGFSPKTVIDLGSGTGNLTCRLPRKARIIAVDTSANMHALAKPKLADHNVEFVVEDILAYVTEQLEPVDVIVSTYALHHLEPEEKRRALEAMLAGLKPGGAILIGDLMFADAADKAATIAHYSSSSHAHVVEDFEEEFFWDALEDTGWLTGAGWKVEVRTFSRLSRGLRIAR